MTPSSLCSSPETKPRFFSTNTTEKPVPERARVQRQNLLVFQTELFVKAADASASIHHLLLAGEEGVTLGANFYSNILLRRSCLDHVATSTTNCGLLIIGMDAFLHACSPLSDVKKYIRSHKRVTYNTTLSGKMQLFFSYLLAFFRSRNLYSHSQGKKPKHPPCN